MNKENSSANPTVFNYHQDLLNRLGDRFSYNDLSKSSNLLSSTGNHSRLMLSSAEFDSDYMKMVTERKFIHDLKEKEA